MRRNRLTIRAIEFLDRHAVQSEYSLAEVRDSIASTGIEFTEAQLEALACLHGVQYLSRSSFQDARYRVEFFVPLPGESMSRYVERRVFGSRNDMFIPDCNTDETHEPEGLEMNGAGRVGVARSPEMFICMYDSPYMIVERDALLEWLCCEYQGSIPIASWCCHQTIQDRLKVATVPEMCDERNAMWYTSDYACVFQGWINCYRTLAVPEGLGAELRVFGRDSAVVEMVRSLIKDCVYSFQPGR